MSPVTHLLASWIIAAKTTDNPRDCRLVALAGIVPDVDGFGLAIDLATGAVGYKPTTYYEHYHHFLLHGVFGALLVAALFGFLARHHWRVAILTLLVFHLHIFCDFIGSRGPSPEDLWPIFYLGPFDKEPMWIWKGQWRLDGWQNRIVFVTLFVIAIKLTLSQGHSVVGVFNRRADAAVVKVFRGWQDSLQTRFSRKKV